MTLKPPPLLLILTFLFIKVHAQNYVVTHYTQNNGLPQNSIHDMHWDTTNLLWLSTEEGLVRFDGNQFYSFNIGNTPYINSDRFRWILRDTNQHLYTTTAYGRVVKIDRHQVLPTHLFSEGRKISRGQIPPVNQLRNMFEDDSQAIRNNWVLPAQFVYVNHQTFVLGHRNIYKISQNQNIDSIPISHFRSCIFFTIGHRPYLFGNGNLYYVDTFLRKLTPIKNPIQKEPTDILSIHISNSVYAVVNKTIFEIIPTNDPLELNYSKIITLNGIVDGEVSCISKSPYDNIYAVGTITNGLYIFKPKHFTTKYYQNNKIKYTGYYAQIPYSDTSILSCYGDISYPSGSHLSQYNTQSINRRTIYKTAKNILWTCKADSLIYQSPGGKLNLIPIPIRTLINNIIPWGDSLVVITLRQVLIIHNKKIIQEITFLPVSTPAPNEDWTFGLIDHDSLILGFDNRIYSIQLHSPYTISKCYEYPSIRSLKKYKNRIWGTSYGQGVFIIENDRLVRLPGHPNGHMMKSHNIEIVNDTNIFISTNNGLFRTTTQEVDRYFTDKQQHIYYQYYSSNEGIENSEFNGAAYPSSNQLANGYVSFSNMSGLVWFKPEHLRYYYPLSNPFLLNRISIDGEITKLNDTIQMTAGNEKLDLLYGVKYWHNTNNIRLEYQLVDEAQNWSLMPPPGQTLTFTNLPPGLHKLKIKCQIGFHSSDIFYTTIYIVKAPHFYETKFFFFLLSLGGTLLIIGLFVIYNKRLLNQNTILEQRVAERTLSLEKTNRILRESEEELKQSVVVKNKLISIISHDIVTPLKFISLVSKNFKSVDFSETENTTEVIKEIHHTSQRLYDNAQNILNWIRFQNNLIRVSKTIVSPYAIVEDLCDLFGDVASMQKSKLLNDVDMDAIIQTDKNIFTIIIQNILSNAVKYTHSSTIRISSTVEKSKYTLIISDDGQGISENNLQRIENIRTKKPIVNLDDSADGTGLGYLIIFELAELIQATITVTSNYKGTTVTISL